MNAARPEPGTPMIFQWRKWDGSPHWRHECVYLGADAWGDWLGQPVGWRSARPGAGYIAEGPNVTLVPIATDPLAASGAQEGVVPGADFALTVNRRHPKKMRIYIDLGVDIHWTDDPLLATGVDMDLDVVRVEGERGTWVDDRDEWEDHRRHYGYPAEVVARLELLALDLEEKVRAQHPPFDDVTADPWLDRLEALGLTR